MSEISTKTLQDNIASLLPVGIFWKDIDRRFLGANQMFLDYYGLNSVDDIIGKTDEDMGWHIDPDPYRSIELRVIQNGESILDVPGQCIVKGTVREIKASKRPLIENGKIIGLVGYFIDVTDAVQDHNRLSALSQTDELTGVLNRRAFSSIVDQYEKQYKKDGSDFALYMIDLDDFKYVNDNYGHEFGNIVLISICKSLKNVSADNSVLFRYGGDEFVILHQYKETSELQTVQKHISMAVDAPRNLDGVNLKLKCSVGYAVFSETLYLSSLIELADMRMYDMKKIHKANNPSLH